MMMSEPNKAFSPTQNSAGVLYECICLRGLTLSFAERGESDDRQRIP
jgi:hypothetical protein